MARLVRNQEARYRPLRLDEMVVECGHPHRQRLASALSHRTHPEREPGERNGEIKILYISKEGAEATQYVANRGNPFKIKNVKALLQRRLE